MIELEERNLEKKSFFKRLILIYFFFAVLFVIFFYKIYSLQVAGFTDYASASLKNKTRDVLLQPARGIIYDRKGNILINNVPSYSLIIKPWKVESLDKFILSIGEIISLNEKELNYVNENFKKKAAYNRELTIKTNLSAEEIARFEVRSYKYPNAFIDVRYSRQSKYPNLFSHAIGYVGGVSDEQLSKILSDQELKKIETLYKYSNGFLTGKTGMEHTYDNLLRGSFGKKTYEVDAAGRFLRELEHIPATNGSNLFTTLDLKSQKTALNQMNNRRGAVVAIEISTGAIVTYLSSPSFSVNDIARGISTKDFDIMLKDKDKPFFDRAGQGRYSPASTIKPLIGLFGIQEKIIDWNFTINDPGFFILPEDQRIYRGWKKGGHGTINLSDALIQSSNTFFFSLAYESNIDKLINYLSEFGFGKNICLDCFNSDKGLLPSPEWKMNNLNFRWFKGDTVNLGVGQGYLSATPIQLSYYSAFLANKGSLNKLSFIKADNLGYEELINSRITDSDWDKLHASMIGVIEDPKGTARRLKSLKSYIVAAKSGTVELVSTDTKEDYQIVRENKGNRDHAIIIAFGPMPNPKYAVSVVIENGESGGSVAGPVAIEVLNSLIKK